MTTPDDLVERAALAICEECYSPRCETACEGCKLNAMPAIRIALEEAAKVAEAHPDAGLATRRDWTKMIGPDIAAAIRAMIKD